MTLHIFNPEHDTALASGLANFTAPHAARQLRHDLGFLPAFWVERGDMILVDDVERAERSWQKLSFRAATLFGREHLQQVMPEFVHSRRQLHIAPGSNIAPWGWNAALKAQLLRRGISERLLPTDDQIDTIRHFSHRRQAATLLPMLRAEGTVGESSACYDFGEVTILLQQHQRLVLKAPWSSSGRGLRFVSASDSLLSSTYLSGWFRNIVDSQGCVMAEPYYNKVKDFGMEFYSDGNGTITYLGLSLFHTQNGAYTGNLLATETKKRCLITRYIPDSLLDVVRERICRFLAAAFGRIYRGPFGIDMMVVSAHPSPITLHPSPFMLHPCVEINLRRTMGHVALALSPTDDDVMGVMRIEYTDNNYRLKINRL